MNFFKALWNDMLSIQAPADIPGTAVTPRPLLPIASEQFPDIAGQHQKVRQADKRLSTLYQRVVAANNANVTRNYGKGDVVVHFDPCVAPLSEKEMQELSGKRAGIKFVVATKLCEYDRV